MIHTSRYTRTVVALGATCLTSVAAADLIGVQPGFPMLFYDSQGITTYNAGTNLFSVDSAPSALRFAPTDPPRLVLCTGNPCSEEVTIQIIVDEAGSLVGGVPGDDLLVVGEVDSDGDSDIDYAGVLLTGEVLQFGFLNLGGSAQNSLGMLGTDVYDMRFQLTGGALAPLFGSGDIGVVLNSEMSSFGGDFTMSFGGEAKGPMGPIDTLLGACCFENGMCQDDLTMEACEKLSGIFQGSGSMCAEVECAPPKGACCFPDGSCGLVTQDFCNQNGGLYQGDGTMCIPGLCPPIKGACCFDDGMCAFVEESECQDAGGDYQGDNIICAIGVCPQPEGACCLPSGGCIVTTQADCADAKGSYQGHGTTCVPGLCEPLTGACCFADGICEVLSEEECIAQGGVFQGVGVECSPGLCDCPPGACCFDDGSCAQLCMPQCEQAGGEFQGHGVSCFPNPCAPPPKGACCFEDGSCAVLTQDDCLDLGGLPQATGTVCIPNPCPQPKGACCFPNGACGVLTQEQCAAQGGLYQGDDTICIPNPCLPPDGACCNDDGTCVVLPQDICTRLGGNYQGNDTQCTPDLCPPVKGACCFGNGICAVVMQMECDDQGGLYQGDDTVCTVGLCPAAPGACCLPDGNCVIADEDDCEMDGGIFQGPLTECMPELCEVPVGACCFTDGSCQILTEEECNAAMGTFQGDNTACEPNKCRPPECTGIIGNFVWEDTDRDGIQDPGEPGIGGVHVTLYAKLPGGQLVFLADTTTDMNGLYLFTELCAGDYQVDFSGGPAGYFETLPNQGPDDETDSDCVNGSVNVSLPTDDTEDLSIDCGLQPPCAGVLGDFIFSDEDDDGIQDPGELGIPNVDVQLYQVLPGNVLVLIDETTTDLYGLYVFEGLCAGDYKIQIVAGSLPDGSTESRPNQGPDDEVDSDCVMNMIFVTLPTSDTVDLSNDCGQIPFEPTDFTGCTPGYWKQDHHFDSWPLPFTPETPFSDVFDNAFPGDTLLDVLWQGGGGLNALGRHTVAALLNSAHPEINYPFTTSEVIAAFNAVFPGSDDAYEALKDQFEDGNKAGCPLD